MKAEDYTHRLAADARNLQELKALAKSDPREALKGAAQQFEAFFMQMMLKSMRETLAQDALTDSDQTRFYTGMLDQQMAQSMGSKGALGLAQILERQLGAALPETSAAAAGKIDALPGVALPPAIEQALRNLPAAATVVENAAPSADLLQKTVPAAAAGVSAPRDFVGKTWPHAVEAAAATGIPAQFMVAHAALETGWGKSEIRRPDGSNSFNLFGVKAGRSWAGDTVEVATTEYVGGKPVATTERFRAYGSYREAFADYAALLRDTPRFNGLLGVADGTDFAKSLQQSGYATDPMYGAKLLRIIQGKTLRDALLG
jgi:peptidoglycan hydrolase FlgJ